MSRTRQQTSDVIPSPVEKYLEWASSQKKFKYYDYEKKETEYIGWEFPFLVLDSLHTCSGFMDGAGGIYANEVRDLDNMLEVKCSGKFYKQGKWADLKKDANLKYTKSLYVCAKDGGDYHLWNIKLKGASLSSWIKFCDEIGGERNTHGDMAVKIIKIEDGKRGAVNYTYPVFSVATSHINEAATKFANEQDTKLQAWLDSKLAAGFGASATQQQELTNDPIEDPEEVPF